MERTEMTTLNRLIAQLLRRSEDGSLAEITENEQQQAANALQSQAERIKELEAEAEQLRKGHFDTSEANAALRSKLKGITICTVIGREIEANAAFRASTLVEYGELCRKMALEEAHAWMMQRHQAQKHSDNYMLVEANRFKKDLLTLPRVEQGSVPE